MAIDAAGDELARLGHDAERAAEPQQYRDREGIAAKDQPSRDHAERRLLDHPG
jgi:hypothetical protein